MRIGSDGWLEGARRVGCDNCDARPEGVEVSLLLVHSISLPPGQYGGDAIERLFTNRLEPEAHPYFAGIADLKVSAHFLVRRGGEVVQFVSVRQRAWHAGSSCWRGRERCNDFSVGVEMEGTDEDVFTAAQYMALARLAAALCMALPLRAFAAHSDIAPGRKTDPGVRFEWRRWLAALAQQPLDY